MKYDLMDVVLVFISTEKSTDKDELCGMLEVLLDDKTVLFDAVDKAVYEVFFENVAYALGGRKLDWLLISHMEPDHAATIESLLLRYPRLNLDWLLTGKGRMYRDESAPEALPLPVSGPSVSRIVVFYSDNTYQEFHPTE